MKQTKLLGKMFSVQFEKNYLKSKAVNKCVEFYHCGVHSVIVKSKIESVIIGPGKYPTN
jgi:hypothetical protein